MKESAKSYLVFIVAFLLVLNGGMYAAWRALDWNGPPPQLVEVCDKTRNIIVVTPYLHTILVCVSSHMEENPKYQEWAERQ